MLISICLAIITLFVLYELLSYGIRRSVQAHFAQDESSEEPENVPAEPETIVYEFPVIARELLADDASLPIEAGKNNPIADLELFRERQRNDPKRCRGS